MLPAALEYPSVDWNGFFVYRLAREERLCEYFGGWIWLYTGHNIENISENFFKKIYSLMDVSDA